MGEVWQSPSLWPLVNDSCRNPGRRQGLAAEHSLDCICGRSRQKRWLDGLMPASNVIPRQAVAKSWYSDVMLPMLNVCRGQEGPFHHLQHCPSG